MISIIVTSAVKSFGVVMILMLIDLITGLLKATKNRNKIESKRLRNSINKAITYFIVLLIGGCLVYAGEVGISTIFTIFLCLVEGVSILENISVVFPNLVIVNKLKEFLNRKAENKLEE